MRSAKKPGLLRSTLMEKKSLLWCVHKHLNWSVQGFETKHLGPWEITFPYFPYQWPKGQMDIWWLLVYWSTCWPPGSLHTWYIFQSPCGYPGSFCSSHHILTLSFYNLEVSFLWSYSSSSMAILTVGALLPPPFSSSVTLPLSPLITHIHSASHVQVTTCSHCSELSRCSWL